MLFNDQDNKAMKLMTYFYRHNNQWHKYNDLATYLSISKKTLRSYIDRLQGLFNELANFEYTGSMVKVDFDPNFGLITMQRTFLNNSLVIRILRAAFFNPGMSKLDLAVDLDTSESSIYRTIQFLNEQLAEHYDLNFSYSDLQFIGDERTIQKFYVAFFIETNPDPFNWPFENYLKEDEVIKVTRQLEEFIENKLYLDDFNYIKVAIAVSVIRLRQGYKIPIKNYDKALLEKVNKIVSDNNIKSIVNGEFPHSEASKIMYQVLNYFFNEDFEFFFNSIENIVCKDKYEFFIENLNYLTKKYNLTVNSPQSFYNKLATYFKFKISNVDTTDFFINHSDFFLNYVRFFNVDFHNELISIMNKYKMQFSPNIKIDAKYLTYIVYTLWPDLIPQLMSSQPPTKALIVCQSDSYYAKTLENIIKSFANSYIITTVYDKAEIDFKEIDKSEYEVIISDFVIDYEFNDKIVFSFEQLPMYDKMQDMMTQIAQKKIFELMKTRPDEFKTMRNELGYER